MKTGEIIGAAILVAVCILVAMWLFDTDFSQSVSPAPVERTK